MLPTATDDTFSVDENSVSNQLDVLANDNSLLSSVVLVVTAVDQPSSSCGLFASYDSSFVYFDSQSWAVGPCPFTYYISDGHGGTASATVTVNIDIGN